MMKITMLAATMMMEIALEDVLHEDGDLNNNAGCCYDGGDYCGYVVNIVYCTEYQCLYGGTGGDGTTTTSATTTITECNLWTRYVVF